MTTRSPSGPSPFRHCPACGGSAVHFRLAKELRCLACGFHYFHNVACAVGVFIRHENRILMAVRGRDPGRGLLDLPGGFVDPGEGLEEALAREVREELAISLPTPRYLGSFPNEYLFDGVLYHTTDAIFEASCASPPRVTPADDVAGVCWFRAREVPANRVAFTSVRRALCLLQP